MFKFKDNTGVTVYVKPSEIVAVLHDKNSMAHDVTIHTSSLTWFYIPDSEEDCRRFLFDLFKAMGETYKYE